MSQQLNNGSDHQAEAKKALDDLFAKFTAVQPGRPLANTFITPQIEVGAVTYLVLGLLEMLVALDIVPAKAVEALLIQARASGQAAYAPAGLQALLQHYAEVMQWSLKKHGAEIDVKAVSSWNQR
jgi:hypothetical protein